MRTFATALAGALLGTAAIVAVAVAVQHPSPHPAVVAGMPVDASMGSMMGGTGSAAVTRSLTIRHVQRGCHVWSNGKTTARMMRLHLMRGQHLSVMDLDVDAHQLMQLSGPTHMRMGGPMMMNQGMTLTFTKPGVYRLGTRTVEMQGGMEVETIGPDNQLRLVVTVA